MDYKNILLLHGFNKTEKDMLYLGDALTSLGYNIHYLRLGLTFGRVEGAIKKLEVYLDEYQKKYSDLMIIAHSTGGIVARGALASGKYNKLIKKLIFIATPQNGSELATISTKTYFYNAIFKPLLTLDKNKINNLNMVPLDDIDSGLIIGVKKRPIMSRFFKEANDGRVGISENIVEGANDKLYLAYDHFTIHHNEEVVKYIDLFIRQNHF